MTALAYAYGTATSDVNSTSTSFVDMSASSNIDAADLQGGEEYLIIARTLLNGNNGNQHFEMQIEAGGSEISGSSLSNSLIEPRRGGASFGFEQMFLHRYTTPATPVDLNQQYRAPSGYRVQSAHRDILAMKLGSDSDALTENSAFYWDEDTTSYAALDSSAWTDTASVTIGDGSSDYLVIAVVHAEVNSTSQSLRIRIGGDVTGAPLDDYLELEGEDTAEVWNCGYSAVLEAPAASTAVTVQVQTDDSSSGAFDVTNVRLVAIQLDAFEAHTIRNTSTATALTPEDAWVELESNISLTTAAATRDVICFTSLGHTTGDTNKAVRLRIQDDTSGDFPHPQFGITFSNGSADRRYTYAIGINPGISASTSLSLDIDAMESADVSPAPTRLNTHVALFVTELAGSTEHTKNLTYTGTGTAALTKQIRKGLSLSGSGTSAALDREIALNQALSYSGTGNASVQKAVSLASKTFSGVGTSSVAKQVQLSSKAFTGTGAAALTRQFVSLLTLTPSGAGTASLGKVAQYVRSLSIAGLGSPSFTRAITYLRALTYGATGSASIQKEVDKLLSHSGLGSPSLVAARSYERSHNYTGTGTATLSTSYIPAGGWGPTTLRERKGQFYTLMRRR